MPKTEKLTPGLEKVKAALDKAFLNIQPKLTATLKAAYRKDADEDFAWLMEHCEKPDPGERLGEYRSRSQAYWDWCKYDKDAAMKDWYASFERTKDDSVPQSAYKTIPPDHFTNFADVAKWKKYCSVDYREADRRAEDSVENAKRSFVGKNVLKYGNVLGSRDVADVTGMIEWKHGIFEGHLDVTLSGGKIVADVSLKFVIRRIPRTTPYYQYPLNFTFASLDDKTLRGPSEEEVRILLGGGPAPTPAEILAQKGYCEGSGWVPKKEWDRRRCSPYLACDKCGALVSVKSGKFRAHYPKK